MKLSQLYEDDEHKWLLEHIKRLKKGQTIDIKNLITFLEDYGLRDVSEIESRLIIIISHLLKYTYQPNKRTKSWLSTITRERYIIQSKLEKSKSLYNKIPALLDKIYIRARKLAVIETGLPIETFPDKWGLTLDQTLEDDRYII